MSEAFTPGPVRYRASEEAAERAVAVLEAIIDGARNSNQDAENAAVKAAHAAELYEALEKISERCPPFDGNPYATPSDFSHSQEYAEHVEAMVSSGTGDIARNALAKVRGDA